MSEFITGIQEKRNIGLSKEKGFEHPSYHRDSSCIFDYNNQWNIIVEYGSFSHVLAVYDSHALPQASTNNLIHNDKKSGTLDTVRIRTFDIDWYTLATVDGPMKVLSGKQVNFILDLTGTSSSTNSIVVTITGDGGQYVLFSPTPRITNL